VITEKLKTRILISFLFVIFILGFSIFFLGYYVFEHYIIDKAKTEVKNNLGTARIFYSNKIEEIKKDFHLIDPEKDFGKLKYKIGLDYLFMVSKSETDILESEIVKEAFFRGEGIGGTRIIEEKELKRIGNLLYSKAKIDIKGKPLSGGAEPQTLMQAMAIEYALPLYNVNGEVDKVMYGGKIINRNFEIVDTIRNFVFENRLYKSKPIGTVTIFLNNIRIATNVLDNNGKRAVGTKVSDIVYKKVIGEGLSWLDRAFVVNNWYLTAYEPMRDIYGNIIGILYVGSLEEPFIKMKRNIGLMFVVMVSVVVVLASFISFIISGTISKPITEMVNGMIKISKGNLSHRVEKNYPVKELNQLTDSFNEMAEELDIRTRALKDSNVKLSKLNKNYLDLVGFVSHELKGVLSSTVLNANSLKEGFLGAINDKQKKALTSVAKNLDYLTATVRNFLDLSRIEKEELELNKKKIRIKEDLFDVSLEVFLNQIEEKEIKLENKLAANLFVEGDEDLLLIVVNNLISNAIKYGSANGKIIIESRKRNNTIEIEIYNDGEPISGEENDKIFQKFYRLKRSSETKIKGTGLGLFVTKEIIEKHDGNIRMESSDTGNSFILQLPVNF